MPFGGPRIIMQIIDADAGEKGDQSAQTWVGFGDLGPLPVEDRLIGLSFSDHEKKKDELVLSFANDDLALFDTPAFVKGQKYLVSFGWPGRLSVPRRFIVVKVEGGNPLVVKMHDTSILLDRRKRHRFERGMTDSEFVRKIAEDHGYKGPTAIVQDTVIRRDVTQPQWRTDAQQCAWLAQRNGFLFFVDAAGFHWHERAWNDEPIRTFVYRADPNQGTILEPPKIEANLSQGVTTVRVLARDPRTKEDIDITVGAHDADFVSLGEEREDGDADDSVGLRADRMTREDVRHLGYMTRAEALAEANARYRMTAQGKYKMSLKIIGDAQIGAKSLIEVVGIADTLDGLWYVKEAKHSIPNTRTFTTTLECTKDSLREVKARKKAERARKVNANKGPDDSRARRVAAYINQNNNTLRKSATLRYGPNGEPVVAWFYVEQGELTTGQLTPAELRALDARAKQAIASRAASATLPDA